MNFSRAASKLIGLGRLFILQVSLTVAIVQDKSAFGNSCGMPARADITGVRLVYETEE